ncbi:MAG: hypothetical protein K2N56_08190 [Oscillospiraceae bacterium]|nr:hypothetical protein [Oscillospiraceae bacterium]
MKKAKAIISILTAAALLASLTGCSSGAEKSDPSSDSHISSPVSDSVDNSGGSGSSDIPSSSDNSDSAPEPQKPDGEPTFLTAPDGTPIYTSQITKYQDPGRRPDGTHEQYPLDTFSRETFSDLARCPEVVCEGFAYAFIPRFNVNVSEAPDKFTESFGIQEYSGEELPPSNEYFKINVGDKFGGLTVKSAESVFSYMNGFGIENAESIHGIYLSDAVIEYEGEVEMTGCIQVMRTEGYETEGNLWFYPDGGCVSKIPSARYGFDDGNRELGVFHYASSGFGAYGELNQIVLGNMYDYGNVDFDGLKPGDTFVRVKITIKDPVISGGGSCHGEPAAVEVLDR